MNVKPGDMAKVIHAPDTKTLGGALVLVVGEAKPLSVFSAFQLNVVRRKYGQIWECQLLSSCPAADAGELLFCADSALRRIDPPEDPVDLYTENPLEGELIKTTL